VQFCTERRTRHPARQRLANKISPMVRGTPVALGVLYISPGWPVYILSPSIPSVRGELESDPTGFADPIRVNLNSVCPVGFGALSRCANLHTLQYPTSRNPSNCRDIQTRFPSGRSWLLLAGKMIQRGPVACRSKGNNPISPSPARFHPSAPDFTPGRKALVVGSSPTQPTLDFYEIERRLRRQRAGRVGRCASSRIYALASKNGWLCMLGNYQPSFEHPGLSPVGPCFQPRENISRWRALESLIDAHGKSSFKVKVRF
jgi:hypothetical protein